MIRTSPVSSPWTQRLERLKSMVPPEENQSRRITPEKIERNREVTQLFHDIGIALDHMLNRQGPPSGANWPLWAAHASERAGAFIRGETTVLGMKGPGRNFLHQANGIAMGDIGGPSGRFIDIFQDDTTPDPKKLETFLASLPDDQLREVFRCYYQAMWEPNAQKKQELTLEANLAYGGREQARLDPFLNKAMEALPGPDVLVAPIAGAIIGLAGLGSLKGFLTSRLRMRWPGFEANLHNDVPKSVEPHNVQDNKVRNYGTLQLSGLKWHLDHWRVVSGHEGSEPDDKHGTGAEYWGDLPQRMHFISEMVREHHMDPQVYIAPSEYAR